MKNSPSLLERLFGPARSEGAVVRGNQQRTRMEPTFAPEGQAAAVLPPAALPDAPTKQASIPSYRTTTDRQTDLLPRTARITANTDVTTFRSGSEPSEVIRNFLAGNPDMAATVNAYLRVGIPERYTVVARTFDGLVDVNGTKIAQEVLRRVTFLGDPTLGYNPTTDLQSLSESLGRELLLEGAMSMELVLDQMQLPTYFQAVATSKLQFMEDSVNGVYPVQVIGGDEIPLDIPTFFYLSVDQDLLSPYASSYVQTALKTVLADEEFNNYLRRQLRRNISPRVIATLIDDNIKKSMTVDMQNDPKQMSAYVASIIAGVTEQLTNLEPEDALVSTDAVEYDIKVPGDGGSGVSEMLKTVKTILQDKVVMSMKSLPAILGRDGSSSGAAASTMLFLKNANIIRTKLNTMYSRVLTTAVRLQGIDCYVQFTYEELDIRPKNEQMAYEAMRQSNILNLLSYGFIQDEEASIQLTGNLPPEGFTPLSGTNFMKTTTQAIDSTSQTSLMGKDKQKADTPTSPKS